MGSARSRAHRETSCSFADRRRVAACDVHVVRTGWRPVRNRRIVRGSCDRPAWSRAPRSPPPSHWSRCRDSPALGVLDRRAPLTRPRSSRSRSQRTPRQGPCRSRPSIRSSNSAGHVESDAVFVTPGSEPERKVGRPAVRQPASAAGSAQKPPRYKLSGVATFYHNGSTAMRLPRGTTVIICGDGGCVERVINDYGPAAGSEPDRRPLRRGLLRHLRLPVLVRDDERDGVRLLAPTDSYSNRSRSRGRMSRA